MYGYRLRTSGAANGDCRIKWMTSATIAMATIYNRADCTWICLRGKPPFLSSRGSLGKVPAN